MMTMFLEYYAAAKKAYYLINLAKFLERIGKYHYSCFTRNSYAHIDDAMIMCSRDIKSVLSKYTEPF